jgi:ABC-type transport system substrate-binding protein
MGEAPESKNAPGTVIVAVNSVAAPGGVNSVGTGGGQTLGFGEDLFTWAFREDNSIDYEVPMLAADWDLASDLSKVTVNLRQGVQFHKGHGEMTAEDVAFSYNMANPRVTPHSITSSAGNVAALLGNNEPVALSTHSVEFTFETFDVAWLSNTMNTGSQVGVMIHSKKLFDQVGEVDMQKVENVIGTGPIQIDSWLTGERATFVPFLDHWSHQPQMDKVILQAIPEDPVRKAAALTGEVDAVFLSVRDTAELVENGFKTTTQGNASQQGIYFSGNYWESEHAATGEPLDWQGSGVYANDLPWIGNPFNPDDGNNPAGMDDMEQARLVRWALAMAVDRETVNQQILNGLGHPIYVEFIDPKSDHWKDKWFVPYDPAEAEAFLDRAGYPRGDDGIRFEMPFLAVGYDIQALVLEIGDAVGGYFDAIGVKSEVLKYPYAVYRPGLISRATTVPILYLDDDGRSIYPHDKPKGLVNSSLTRGGYCVCFEAPELAQLYIAAAKETSKEKRLELADQFIDFVHFWALQPGVVVVPSPVAYNPNSIKEWKMVPTDGFVSALHNIVPNR